MKRYRIKETGVELEEKYGRYYLKNTNAFEFSGNDLEAIGLTLEEIKPEVRKLYAYSNLDTNQVVFCYNEEKPPSWTAGIWFRDSAYDITYPEEIK